MAELFQGDRSPPAPKASVTKGGRSASASASSQTQTEPTAPKPKASTNPETKEPAPPAPKATEAVEDKLPISFYDGGVSLLRLLLRRRFGFLRELPVAP